MKRGDVYRTAQRLPERGDKPGFYVVVSRSYVSQHESITTVICAPVYSKRLGIRSEVDIGPADGLPRDSAIRCDFLTLLFKERLIGFVSTLGPEKRRELDDALAYALEIGPRAAG